MKPAQVRELFKRLQSLNPDPVTELEHASPFELLIAVILSAQATDKSVNIATRRLFPVASTPQQILALGADGHHRATEVGRRHAPFHPRIGPVPQLPSARYPALR